MYPSLSNAVKLTGIPRPMARNRPTYLQLLFSKINKPNPTIISRTPNTKYRYGNIFYLYYCNELPSILSNSWLNVKPAAFAAWGTSEWEVIPGRVFVSST